jgi:hypothetical protein
MSITDGIGEFLFSRTSRRGFLAKATVTATALSVAPVDLLVRPGSAYAQICECAPGYDCGCSDLCCDGFTQFCCTINNGVNACPPGTFAGGWWKADGSIYCAGPRYYVDCMGECHGCGCGGGAFCPSCDGLYCECAIGNCGNRHVGCTEFRYGQCHQEIGCSGRIACRMVSCTPPWELDATCTTASATDDSTADHFAPCQAGPISYSATGAGMARSTNGAGYWLVDSKGGVHTFGNSLYRGSEAGYALPGAIVGIAATPNDAGYWIAVADGGVYTFGSAGFHGSARGRVPAGAQVVGIAATPSGNGYWLVVNDGGVFTFGDAPFYGSARGRVPTGSSVVGMAALPNGRGYWLAVADGGVFSFGQAPFWGSARSSRPPSPIVGMAPFQDGRGYWLAVSDGGVYSFGYAPFWGSARGRVPANLKVIGIASRPQGDGYWLPANNGGLYTFGAAPFYGSGAPNFASSL